MCNRSLVNKKCWREKAYLFSLIAASNTPNSGTKPFSPPQIMNTISYLCLFLSLVGLILTIMALTLQRSLWRLDMTKIHVYLSMSLFVGYVIFLVGIDQTQVLPLSNVFTNYLLTVTGLDRSAPYVTHPWRFLSWLITLVLEFTEGTQKCVKWRFISGRQWRQHITRNLVKTSLTKYGETWSNISRHVEGVGKTRSRQAVRSG